MDYAKKNLAFWLLGLASFTTLLLNIRNNHNHLIPLTFLIGSITLIWTAPFPAVQYQLFCFWGVLLSLPYFINICCEAFPKRKTLIFSIVLLLASSGTFTFTHYSFPFKSLRAYAAEIDRVREAIGQNKLASFGGASIDINTVLPFCDSAMQFRCDENICQSTNIRGILKKEKAKFVFIDQRKRIKDILLDEDSHFIRSNYQKCMDLPLMIASKWVYTNPKINNINIEIGGEYKVFLFSDREQKFMLDNQRLKQSQVLKLKQGKHSIRSTRPAVLLIEFNSNKINSESLANLNQDDFSFIPLSRDFSGKFKLLGILKYQKGKKFFCLPFWKVLSDINEDLMTFHHFIDKDQKYISGANIDPADGWYDIRNLKKGDLFSYQFTVDRDQRFNSMNIGWYYKQDWSKRLECNGSTFFKLYQL